MKLKILLYGELWTGTHVDCISKVFKQKNINYKIFDFYKIISPILFGNIIDKINRKAFYHFREKKINNELLKEIDSYKPSVLLISKGLNIYPETLKVFKSKNIIIANWNPDDFFNKLNSNKNLLNSLGIYDYVFSARKHLFDQYKSKGITNPIYLDWYYIPWLHHKPLTFKPIENKITFIGTHSERREHILSSVSSKFPINIWGSGWGSSKIGMKSNVDLMKKELSQKLFPEIMSSSRVNLNILTKENRDLTNLKIFEITASCGLMLSEHNPTIKNIMKDDCFYFEVDKIDELNNTLNYLFNKNNDKSIEEVRLNGYNNIKYNSHSINDRVDKLLKILN